MSYSEPEGNGAAGTTVPRRGLGEASLENMQVIYRQQPKVSGLNHFGSRLVFAHDGSLFVTQGDRLAYREQAQDLSSGIGKIVRINPDGSVPKTIHLLMVRGLDQRLGHTGTEISKAPRSIRRRVNFGLSSTALAAATS